MVQNATRKLKRCFDDKGNPCVKTNLSTSNHCIRAEVELTPKDVIPVIFLPGIMGTNLVTQSGEPVWLPPNGLWQSISQVWNADELTPEVRQQLFNKKTTKVFSNDEAVEISEDFLHLEKKEAIRRGWGEVHWKSYGKFLLYLEETLNTPFMASSNAGNDRAPAEPWQEALFANQENPYYKEKHGSLYRSFFKWKQPAEHWGAQKSLVNYTEAEHEHTADFYFPVYAIGYNWLQSNADSACAVAKKLVDIKKHYETSAHFCFKKFIVVTHSMGGLVARGLVNTDANEDIAGVVHGVQPVHGAPAVYRRFTAGTEGSGVVNALVARLIGWSATHITPVLGYSTGALELLPNKQYNGGKPWLFFQTKQGVINELPVQGNPYNEIYKKRGVWWEMVTQDFLDPANLYKDKPIDYAFEYHIDALDDAENFHNSVTEPIVKFHSVTYGHFGADEDEKAMGTLTWSSSSDIDKSVMDFERIDNPKFKLAYEQVKKDAYRVASLSDHYVNVEAMIPKDKPAKGDRVATRLNGSKLETHTFKISKFDVAGDGTVPQQSGAGLMDNAISVKQVFKMEGFDHQGSYNDKHVRQTVLYSIGKMVQDIA